jgi:membrane protease YdiL (CAAX protease family)
MQSLAFLSPQRKFVATGLMALGALIVYYLFPFDGKLNETVQAIASGLMFLLLLPVLYTKLILKESLGAIGFRGSVRRHGWISVPLVTVPVLSVLYLLVRYYPVEDGYYIPSVAVESFWLFVLYELLLVGTIIFLYEVFFRGFVQLLWLKPLGLVAVLLQAILFFVFVLVTDGVTWQSAPMLFAAISAGFVAHYTRSIWYSWGSAWLVLFLADAYMLTLR